MPLFLCDKCKCIDNTALGWYWSRNSGCAPKEMEGLALCSECAPVFFKDGTKTEHNGKWHSKFPKKNLEEYKKECEAEGYKLDLINYP